jgi:hypothetical protein
VFGVQSNASRTVPSGAAADGDATVDGDGATPEGTAVEALGDGLAAPGPQAPATTAMHRAAARIRFMLSFSTFDSKYETPSPKERGRRHRSRRACFLRRY